MTAHLTGKSNPDDFAHLLESQTLLTQLADSLRGQRSVLTAQDEFTKGMRSAYTFVLAEVDSFIRREHAAAQAKAEYHAKAARLHDQRSGRV